MQRRWHMVWNSWLALIGACLVSTAAVAGEPSVEAAKTTREMIQVKQEREELKAKLLTELRALRMWRITEELKLDEATAAKIFPLLSRYDDLERQAGKDRALALELLGKSIEQGVESPAVLNPQLDRVVAMRVRKGELDREKIGALRKILPPSACAKLLLLLHKIDEEFRERIKRALPSPTQNPAPKLP